MMEVAERHGLDVEGGQDGFLVCQGGVVIGGDFGREDDAHVAQVDVDRSEVGSAQRRALRSDSQNQSFIIWSGHTSRMEIFGRFCRVFHSLLM